MGTRPIPSRSHLCLPFLGSAAGLWRVNHIPLRLVDGLIDAGKTRMDVGSGVLGYPGRSRSASDVPSSHKSRMAFSITSMGVIPASTA
jgi:hypothetical protein